MNKVINLRSLEEWLFNKYQNNLYDIKSLTTVNINFSSFY